MKSRFIIPLVVCFVLAIGSAGVAWGDASPKGNDVFLLFDRPYDELYRMNETAAALYRAAYTNNRQLAYAELQKLSKMLDNDMLGSYGSAEGWQMLQQDADKIEASLASGVKHSMWLEQAVRIRLGADSLVAGNQGLWLQYEKLLLEDLSKVRKAWKRGAGDPADAATAMMRQLELRANRIQTAAAYSGDFVRSVELMERINYTYRLLRESKATSTSGYARNLAESSLDGIHTAIIGVFEREQEVSAIPAVNMPQSSKPIQWALLLGMIISAVLAWTGWRKYKQTPYGVKKL